MQNQDHVIITGGGSGLGLGIALRYLARGNRVSILDLSVSDESSGRLDEAAKTGRGAWQSHVIDIADLETTQSGVDQAVEAFGAPCLAINSAGIVLNKTFEEMTPDQFRRVIDINVHGSYHFAKAVLPSMTAGSRLALIASIAGLVSNYAYSAYGTSKFAVVGLATTLRYEYEPRGIRISCICPPEVKTPLVAYERSDANPVSLELKPLAGSLEIDDACDQIVAGLDAGRWQIVPGFMGKLTVFAARYFPWPFHAAFNALVRRAMRKHGAV